MFETLRSRSPVDYSPLNFLSVYFLARGAMLRATHVASAASRRLSCTLRESERFRASKPVKDPWETTSGAETRLEHCAWFPSAPRLLGAGSTNKKRGLKGALGGWVVAWARGRVGWRARWGCEGGCVASGHGARVGEGWSTPRVLTAWEGRVCVA